MIYLSHSEGYCNTIYGFQMCVLVTSVLYIYIFTLRCKLLIQNCADGDIFYFIDTYCTFQVIFLDFTDELAVKVKFFNSEQYT